MDYYSPQAHSLFLVIFITTARKKEDVAKYDLCTAVVNDLIQKAIKWKKKGVNEKTRAISV
jgi:hypothetical protein